MILNIHDYEIREEGLEEGQNKFGKLIHILLDQGRTEDASRASNDPEYRDQLYREFQIV